MKIIFDIGFFIALGIFLLSGANMIAYRVGYYKDKGGKAAYLKRHYTLLVTIALWIILLGITYDHFFPKK